MRESNPRPLNLQPANTITIATAVAVICVSPQIWVPPTHIPRDICSPTQISLIIMQQWEVFPQGKMFPQMVRWLIDTCIYCA